MRFVDDIKQAWRWFSLQLITVAFIWETLPEETKDTITPDVVEPYVTAALLVTAAVGRLIKQKETK